MRIPITKYGLPQAAAYPAAVLALMFVYGLFFRQVFPDSWHTGVHLWLAGVLPELILFGLLVWVVSFFRDPKRKIPEDPALLLSPADGRISDIEEVREPLLGGEPVLRIGIFLSIFNVHINRMPCAVRVRSVLYKPGKFLNALHGIQAGKLNESNNLLLERIQSPEDLLLVRQISGAIARRIVCEAKENQTFTAGQPFGMIKFGSRTELYVPASPKLRVLVKIGDKVKAGQTPLARYER
jgi:phosphatidylserine decarboxylase